MNHLPHCATCCLALVSLLPAALSGQEQLTPNYDEARVPDYQLPPIVDEKTAEATGFAAAWETRRSDLLQTFAEQMYGHQPTADYDIEFDKFESGPSHDGKAQRQQWRVTLSTEHASVPVDLLVFTPADVESPVACFLGLNFYGNHTVAGDPEIRITESWSRDNEEQGARGHRATAEGRGKGAERWPVEQIVGAGFAVATAYCGDIDPDFHDEFRNGVHALFPDHRPSPEHPDRWGTISAWAWGLSRMLDCLEQIPEIEPSRVAVIGHSRLGKTALWAGATDPRFAIAISNNSGCGGAALSRRAYGETVGRINESFPHWFCPNFHRYNQNESALPIDQHQLIALMAPRLVYVASATDDQWADPHGEFLALHTARDLFSRLAGSSGSEASPELRRLGYHLREGRHAITAWDWAHYIQFAQQLH